MRKFTLFVLLAACGTANDSNRAGLSAVTGSGETVLRGDAGVELRVPAGALPEGTRIEITGADDQTPLPAGAHAIGPQFEVLPTSLDPTVPLELTLPFDPAQLDEFGQEPVMVKVWLRRPDLATNWELIEQTASTADTVTIALERVGTVGAGVKTATATF